MSKLRLVLSAVMLVGITAFAAPQLQFEETAVIASQCTPGAGVVFFGVSREPQPWGGSRVVPWQVVLHDTDRDGIVRYDLGRPIPFTSVWSAVDLATGERVQGTRAPFPLREIPWPSDTVREDRDGLRKKVELQWRGAVDLLWVRPGEGAWTVSLQDGGPMDEERKNDGRIAALLENMKSLVSGVDAPRHLKKDDVLVVIDQRRLEIFGGRIEH